MPQLKAMVDFIKLRGKDDYTWAELAQKFGYNTEDGARKAWSRHQKNETENLVLKKETRDRRDQVTHRTFKNEPIQPALDTEGLRLKRAWVTPEGRVGKTFEADDLYGISENEIPALFEKINKSLLIQSTPVPTPKVGTVVVSDIHAGAILRALDETIYKDPFDTDILNGYLSRIVSEVNAMQFSEVHLIIPGDIVESFTAFNHRDTWKHVEKHQGALLISVHEILRQFFSQIYNLKCVYMVEGNHDRMTKKKEGNSRKGVVEVTAYFLQQISDLEIVYHPWMIRKEIDGIFYIVTHGDLNSYKNYDSFFFQYGKQDIFNAFITGHFHSFKVLGQGRNYIHFQSPSVNPGGFFEESQGFNSPTGYLICTNSHGKVALNMKPL